MSAIGVMANSLTLKLTEGTDIIDAECQIINLSFQQPSTGDPSLVYTSCPDGAISEPGDPQNGSLSGEVFADWGPTGISRFLTKYVDIDVDYVLTLNADDTIPGQMTIFTGTAKVKAPTIVWTPKKTERHDITLSVVTAAVTFDGP